MQNTKVGKKDPCPAAMALTYQSNFPEIMQTETNLLVISHLLSGT